MTCAFADWSQRRFPVDVLNLRDPRKSTKPRRLLPITPVAYIGLSAIEFR
jgi:hypothetical protein